MESVARVSKHAIAEKRRKKRNNILLTGGTGFLGSHIAMELLRREYPVLLLCRPSRDLTALQRVEQLLAWFEVSTSEISNLEVIEGAIDRPQLGLSDSQYSHLLEYVDEVVHCAANTSFAKRKKEEVETGNVKALHNVVDLAVRSKCYYFHQVSTAYVAGKRTGRCEEELVKTKQFTNIYEETKYRAERYVSKICRKEGIRLNIYRPSIVYGHSRNGKSIRFNALYYPMKMLLFLREIYERDIKERGGKQADKMGIRVGNGNSMYLPIRVEKKESGGINLIPVDYFVESFVAIMEECLDGGVFHIVSRRPKKLDDLIEYTKRLFNISGITAASKEDFDKVPKNALEILFDSYLDTYHPYLRDTRIFSNEKAESILHKKNINCPDLNFTVFAKCMGYAVEVEWGKKLFKRPTQSNMNR